MSKLFNFRARLVLTTFRPTHKTLVEAAFPASKVNATGLRHLFNELEDIEERYVLSRANSENEIRVESKHRTTFCQQFWRSLLNDTLVARAITKGFTLEYLEKRKLRLEQNFNKVSQGEASTFEIIINEDRL